MKLLKLNPNERIVVESGINHYRLAGPGLVWLKPWQRVVTRLNTGPQSRALRYQAVRTAEEIPVDITVQLLYRVDPALCDNRDLLPKLGFLNDGGWRNLLEWRTEAILRQLVAAHNWKELNRQPVRQRLERYLCGTLGSILTGLGLNIVAVCLVKIELPISLQKTAVQAANDNIEAEGRARVLKTYIDIFNPELSQTMAQIVQWELLNMLHKKGNPQLLLAARGLSLDGHPQDNKSMPLQLSLPLMQKGQNGKSVKPKR